LASKWTIGDTIVWLPTNAQSAFFAAQIGDVRLSPPKKKELAPTGVRQKDIFLALSPS
jgi:hypothetical protein